MMKQTRTRLELLQNAAWYTYLTFVVKLISQNETIKTLMTSLLTLLEKIHRDAGEALEILRTNQLSKEVDEADMLRDRLFIGLKAYLRAFIYDPDPASQRAAENLLAIVEHYGDVPKAAHDQESGLLIDCLKELNSHPQEIELLGLEKRLAQLETANNSFIEILDSRTLAIGNRTPLRMTEIRREGNRIIRLLYDQIDILQQTAPTAELTQFAAELNAENVRVNGNLRRKSGE